jgi:pimeloyl-ACP methyl ester carboxylesterase
MPFHERDQVRIHYEEAGSGFPLFIIPGGGLNASIAKLGDSHPFNPMVEFSKDFRCIAFDLRNANGGESTGPLEVDRPWEAHAEDMIGLLDHLGIQQCLVMGFCIGNPLLWNLIRHAPGRVIAAVSAQPSGFRADLPDHFYRTNTAKWGPALCARRPDITPDMVDRYLKNMYLSNPDFVFSVSRDFVRNCQIPLLVMPDDTDSHVYTVAMEMVHLAPNAQVSLFPWKDTRENTRLAVRHARTFLRANRPAA